MKHIAFAVVAAAALSIIGPHLSATAASGLADIFPRHGLRPTGEEIHSPASTRAGVSWAEPVVPTSMLRMRAGEAPPSRFYRR